MIYYKEQTVPEGIGGKASGLYKLQSYKLKVPDFLVIPYSNFQDIVESKKGDAKQVRQSLQNYSLPEIDKAKLKQILKSWDFPNQKVVVRSSVADEDGESHAFPGMMSSFLNLGSLEDVLRNIGICASSAYSERALAYRKQKGLSQIAHPAVLIQKQIEADSSGVLFTTFPEYPQELAIHSVWGFGEGLMNGQMEADEYYFEKKRGVLHRQKVVEKEKILKAKPTTGLEVIDLPLSKKNQPSLDLAILRTLFQRGTLLENSFKFPLDIEFAVAEGTVYFLQARPITQKIPEVIVYDNSNIQESYCGVTTPLTFSFAKRAYATVYRQTMGILGFPKEKMDKYAPVVENLLGLVKGRIYYNINNWYRGLQLLPSFKQNKADMERMMGVQEPVDFIEDREKSLAEKLKMFPGLAINLFRLWRKFKQLDILVPRFHEEFQKHYNMFYSRDFAEKDLAQLLNYKEILDQEIIEKWTTPIINDFYVMMNNGAVHRKLRKAGIEKPEEFLSRYLSGDQEIESTQPVIRMTSMAKSVRRNESLKNLILSSPENLSKLIEDQFPEFYKEVNDFIHKYGDRTVGELKLETKTMRIVPSVFYKYLRNFLSDEVAQLTAQGHLSSSAEKELDDLLLNKSYWFKNSLKKSLKSLKKGISNRESMRLERTRLFGMYRAIYIEIGKKFYEGQLIDSAEDIFYLQEEEIKEIVAQPPKEIKYLIIQRKKEFEEYKKIDIPSRIEVPSPPVEVKDEAEVEGFLSGTGCFPGIVEGEVIVIRDPTDNLDVKGKIICALRTDPGWGALFPSCKGVLIEKGSSLSHSVILLRELGIPTIINIPRLTRRLSSGMKVNFDAATGQIKII